MNEPATQQARLSALDKALTVLDVITDQPQPIGLPDLTARLGMPRQTLHRLLLQLEAIGLIVRDPSRARYMVGPSLARLALNVLLSANQTAPVRSILQGLVDSIEETCNIGVLDGMSFLYLERIETNWTLRVHLQAGSRVPAHCSAGGKMLLAHLPEDLRHRMLTARPLPAFTDNSITDPDVLMAQLDESRRQGFAVNDQEATVGIVGLAVPIVDPSGKAVAALACHAPAARYDTDGIRVHLKQLSAAAEALARYWDDGVDP